MPQSRVIDKSSVIFMPRICIGAKAKFRGVKFYDNLKDKFCGELRSAVAKFNLRNFENEI